MQSSLLGAIRPNIRAVACRWDFNSIYIRSVYDGEISDLDKESMGDVTTEVISHFPDFSVRLECVRHDAPGRLVLDVTEVYVYRRFEA